MIRPEKLRVSRVVKKLPVSYGTQVLPLDRNRDQFNLVNTLQFHKPTKQAAKELRTENQAKRKSNVPSSVQPYLRPERIVGLVEQKSREHNWDLAYADGFPRLGCGAAKGGRGFARMVLCGFNAALLNRVS
jgi:hypothetical protein